MGAYDGTGPEGNIFGIYTVGHAEEVSVQMSYAYR
jgi:hypothetical protein